jgi:glucose/arabinose dehydrogenase
MSKRFLKGIIMSKFILSIVFASVASISSPAFADIEKIVVTQGKTQAKQTNMDQSEFTQIEGRYNLNNGDKLIISKSQNRLYAQIGDANKVQLISTQTNSFKSKDQSISIEFETQDLGKSNNVNLIYSK